MLIFRHFFAIFKTQVQMQKFQLFQPYHHKSLLFHWNIDVFKCVRSQNTPPWPCSAFYPNELQMMSQLWHLAQKKFIYLKYLKSWRYCHWSKNIYISYLQYLQVSRFLSGSLRCFTGRALCRPSVNACNLHLRVCSLQINGTSMLSYLPVLGDNAFFVLLNYRLY